MNAGPALSLSIKTKLLLCRSRPDPEKFAAPVYSTRPSIWADLLSNEVEALLDWSFS